LHTGGRSPNAATIRAARDHGALAQLTRVLGRLDDLDHPLGVIWRRGDLLRERLGEDVDELTSLLDPWGLRSGRLAATSHRVRTTSRHASSDVTVDGPTDAVRNHLHT